MRLSAVSGDPGHVLAATDPRTKVFFEGVERRFVITADEERRYLLSYQLGESGRPRASPDGEWLLVREEWGHVRIELPPT